MYFNLGRNKIQDNAFSRELAQLAELAHTVEPAHLDEPGR
jgi:hypothetical protein